MCSMKILPVSNTSKNNYSTSFTPKNENDDRVERNINNNSIKKLIIPSTLILGGLGLIYVGIKRPSASNIYKTIVQDHIGKMDKAVFKFMDFCQNYINLFFKNSIDKIQKFKTKNIAEFDVGIGDIKKCKSVKSLFETQNKTFLNLKTKYTQNDYLSTYERFIKELEKEYSDTNNRIDFEKYKTELICQDLEIINTDKEFIKRTGKKSHQKAYDKAISILKKQKQDSTIHMEKVKTDKLKRIYDLIIKIMSDAVTDSRNIKRETKYQIIEQSFAQLRQILKNDIRPSYKSEIPKEKLLNDSDNILKSIKIPQQIKMIFENSPFKKFIESDYTKAKDKDYQEIFERIPIGTDIEDLKLSIDRIRIYNEIEKLPESEDIIKKIQLIYLKLKDYGQKEFIKKAQNFEQSNVLEKNKAQLSYINSTIRRLGFDTIAQAHENANINLENYNNTPLSKFLEEKLSDYTYYFM